MMIERRDEMLTYTRDTVTPRDTELDRAVERLQRVLSTAKEWDTITRRPCPSSSEPRVTPKGKTLYIVQGRAK